MRFFTLAIAICALSLTTFQNADATVHRVNNRAGIDADFTSFSTAHAAAAVGDTIYMEGSPSSYSNWTVTKELVIIGPGYFLDENDSTQAYSTEASAGTISFNAGSEGSVVQGMLISRIAVNTDSITIRRNRVYFTSSDAAIDIGNAINYTLIEQNYIWQQHSSSSTSYSAIFLSSNNTGTIIRNNVIRKYTTTVDYTAIYMPISTTNTLIRNNVIWGRCYSYNSTWMNNILGIGTLVEDVSYPST